VAVVRVSTALRRAPRAVTASRQYSISVGFASGPDARNSSMRPARDSTRSDSDSHAALGSSLIILSLLVPQIVHPQRKNLQAAESALAALAWQQGGHARRLRRWRRRRCRRRRRRRRRRWRRRRRRWRLPSASCCLPFPSTRALTLASPTYARLAARTSEPARGAKPQRQ